MDTQTQSRKTFIANGQKVTQSEALAYLQAVAPSLHTKASRAEERFPALSGRALRAALIVAAQGVRLTNDTAPGTLLNEVARVQGVETEYIVCNNPAGWSCTCKDWQGEAAPVISLAGQNERICKHILAALMCEEK